METRTLAKATGKIPALLNDFFTPWNEWFDNGNIFDRALHIPAVNIAEHKDAFHVSLAAPGLKKDDFNIDINGNMLTISSEKEESKEDKEKKFTRKEYNYTSFSRSFTLPEGINRDKIEAKYDNGVLNITLPRKEEAKHVAAKQITVK